MSNWKPFYPELASQLSEYEHRQADILTFLEDLRAAGRTITPLIDEAVEGNKFPLETIDPFTVFGVFNRGIKAEERIRIAEAYRGYFGLETPAPTILLELQCFITCGRGFSDFRISAGQVTLQNYGNYSVKRNS